MILMLDQQKYQKSLFYTFKSESGQKISLTKYHLIPIRNEYGNEKYLFAKQIQIGDYLYILNNQNQIQYSKIINRTIEIKNGYYAPLTTKGTLLVNQILVSSFAHIHNQHLAQISMFPLRFYYHLTKLIHYPFNNQSQSQGLFSIIKSLINIIHFFNLQILSL